MRYAGLLFLSVVLATGAALAQNRPVVRLSFGMANTVHTDRFRASAGGAGPQRLNPRPDFGGLSVRAGVQGSMALSRGASLGFELGYLQKEMGRYVLGDPWPADDLPWFDAEDHGVGGHYASTAFMLRLDDVERAGMIFFAEAGPRLDLLLDGYIRDVDGQVSDPWMHAMRRHVFGASVGAGVNLPHIAPLPVQIALRYDLDAQDAYDFSYRGTNDSFQRFRIRNSAYSVRIGIALNRKGTRR